jgi:hypothetical protein
MSRAYRIRVRESISRVLRAQDKVSTQLELLEILSPEEMGALLADELERRGFKKKGAVLTRQNEGVTVTVDVKTGTVTVQAEACETVSEEGERSATSWEETGHQAERMKRDLREALRKDLDKAAQAREAGLQSKVTDQLEAQLGDLRKELDQAVNRVTADALKQKAAQLGQIKEMTEDREAGSLTIVLEV